jgi:hypothetical protein
MLDPKKFDENGIINVEAMRNDVKNDPRFFDKKNGNFTRSGKERLAAIEEISTVQNKGLKYKINDNNTFDIVDKSGKITETVEGKGIETGRKITPFYGTLNKEKRSKKEISKLMGEVSGNSNKKETTTKETTIPVEAPEKKSKKKVNNSLLTDAKSIIQSVKDQLVSEKDKQTTTVEPVADKRKATLTSKIAGELPTEESKPTEKNSPQAVDNKKSKLDDIIAGALMDNISSKNPVVQRESEVLKSKVDYINSLTNNNFLNQEEQKEKMGSLDVAPDSRERQAALQFLTQGDMASAPVNIQENKLAEAVKDYKKLKESLFNEKIKDLDAAMKAIESHVSFHPKQKKENKAKLINAKLTLEKLKKDFYTKSDDDHKLDLMSQFGSRVSVHKNGGRVEKFRTGNKYRNKKRDDETSYYNEEGLSQEDIDKQKEYEADFLDQQEQLRLEKLGAEQDEQMLRYTANANKNASVATNNPAKAVKSYKITNPDKTKDDGLTTQNNNKKDPNKKSNVLDFLNGYKPSGVGIALGGTLAKWAIARQALKDPVTIVKPLQSVYTEHGSRNVQAARDIDASSIQAAKNAITGIHTRYKGSDPILSVLLKKADQKEKMDQTSAWVDKRATYRRGEEDRVNLEMEEKRLQGAEDLQNITKNSNLNKEYQYKADIANAEALAKRKSDIAAADIAGVEEGTKTLSGWLGDRRAVDDQFKSDLAGKVIAGEQSKYAFAVKSAEDKIADARFYAINGTPEQKAQALEDYKTASKELTDARKAYNDYDATSKIVSTKDEIDNPIFNLLFRRKSA